MNLQQIPSHETSMRMMFKASTIYNNEHIDDNDEIVGDDGTIYKIVNIETIDDKIKLKLA